MQRAIKLQNERSEWLHTIWTTNAPAGGVFQDHDYHAPQPAAYYQLMWNGN